MTVQEENNKLLKDFFEYHFFKHYTPNSDKFTDLLLLVTGDCNMKCEYCYYARHGDILYPKELRDPKLILDNLRILLDWFVVDRKFYTVQINLFSGEFFNGELGMKVLEMLYEYHKKYQKFFGSVVIPTNFSFIRDDEKTERIYEMYKRYEDEGLEIFLSCSVDGKYIDHDARITVGDDSWRTDEYYDKMFKFIKKIKAGTHPMLSWIFVENYEENYKWWVDNTIKYDLKFVNSPHYHTPMILEVRNDDWTDERIKKYCEMLRFMVRYDLEKYHNGDVHSLTNRIFHRIEATTANETIRFPLTSSKISCAVQSSPAIRLGDLSLQPCHRTAYPQFKYGDLVVKDGKITGEMIAHNWQLALKIYSMNPNVSHPRCSGCLIRAYCARGCLGSQFEATGDIFTPIDSVCKLYFAKLKTMHEIFLEYNMYEITDQDSQMVQNFISVANQLYNNKLGGL